MKALLSLVLACAICLATSGCMGNGVEEIPSNSKWKLVSFGPVGDTEPVLSGTNITLEFEENKEFRGSAGCNHYSGSYRIEEGNKVVMETIISTEMWCQDEGVMEQESRYLGSLRNVTSFKVEGDNLKLFYNDGKGVLHFTSLNST